MRRWIGVFCAAVLLLGLTACGGRNQARELTECDPRAGDYVLFGSFEQDGDPSNGPERIQWLVLDRDDERHVLLLSRWGLDAVPFDDSGAAPVTWTDSTLRAWMNGLFYPAAFTEEERTRVLEAGITAEGEVTADRVFALSREEAQSYLTAATAVTDATPYARARGAFTYTEEAREVFAEMGREIDDQYINDTSEWWLRSVTDGTKALFVFDSFLYGSYGRYISEAGSNPEYTGACARPAIWVDTND